MPIKVGTLITNLAKKVGIDPNTIAIPAEQFDLPEELVSAIDSKLYTEDAAKNNSALKNYFFKQALDGVDNNITKLLEDFQLGDDDKGEILGIKSSYDRIPALVKKIQSLESQKAGANKGQTAQLQEQINELNREKAKLLSEKENEIKQIKTQYDNEFTDNLKRLRITAANLVTDQYGEEAMRELAYSFLEKELAAADAKAVRKNGMLKLVKASDEALEYYHDNKPVEFDEFLNSVLSKHKLIAVSKPAPPPGTPPINTPKPGDPQPKPANTSFAALLAQSQADLAKG